MQTARADGLDHENCVLDPGRCGCEPVVLANAGVTEPLQILSNKG